MCMYRGNTIVLYYVRQVDLGKTFKARRSNASLEFKETIH